MNRVVALLFVTALGCSSDGQTPKCEEYPDPFVLTDPSEREAAWRELESLAGPPYFCATLPAGFRDAEGSSAGAAGSAGDASQ